MFKEISKGRYEIVLDGKPKEITVSFGLKAELYKVISRGQLASAKLSPQVYMSQDTHKLIVELNTALNKLKEEEPDNAIGIAAAEAELEKVYAEGLADLEARQKDALFDVAVKHIDLASEVMAEGLACLLSERDERGKVIGLVLPEEILWDPKYVDASDQLLELLTAVTDYITSALKKISNLKTMVDSTVVKPKEPEKIPTSE